MGGKGSGRKPDPLKQWKKQTNTLKARPEIKQPIATGMFLPNHAGIARHPEAKKTFGHWTRTGTNLHPTNSGDYVGIGTNSPIASLHIYNATGGAGPLIQTGQANGDAKFVFQNPSNIWQFGLFNNQFRIVYGATTALYLDSSRKIYIPVLSSAGFVKNTASGELTGGNTIDISSDTNLSAGTNITLSGDTLNVDDAFIKNNADDTSTGKITASNFAVTSDNNTNDSEYVPMVLHGTDATPPTASNYPRGTIYIQYSV